MEKKLAGYYDLYIQSYTLLLAYVFQNFQNISLKIHELDPARLLTASVLAWQAALKETN